MSSVLATVADVLMVPLIVGVAVAVLTGSVLIALVAVATTLQRTRVSLMGTAPHGGRLVAVIASDFCVASCLAAESRGPTATPVIHQRER